MTIYKTNSTNKPIILAVTFFLSAALYTVSAFAVTDPVVLTFSTVGDSRQDSVNIDPSIKKDAMIGVGNCQTPSGTGLTANPGLSGQDCKWLQNSTAWSRILREIQLQKAKLLFFNGDMIMGYGKTGVPVTRNSTATNEAVIAAPSITDILNSDLMQSYKQYAFWRGMVANLMETGTYIVPVPGNHEVQCKRCNKVAQVENENAWRDNMGDLLPDISRFTTLVGTPPENMSSTNPGVADGIKTNQSQLSFSFDVGKSHFVVINTDPVGKDGYAPTNWLEADLTNADLRGAKRIFVFGHKPAVFYDYVGSSASSTSSLNDKDSAASKDFWTVIDNHKATYFCGHEHTYNVSKPYGKNSYQVLVGSGGSPFETSTPTFVASDRMYSWATVQIFESGKVTMDTWGFDPAMTGSTIKIDSIELPTK
jgi:hypothetical protein